MILVKFGSFGQTTKALKILRTAFFHSSRFGEDVVARLINFIEDMEDVDKEETEILDLGTGNGYTLFELVCFSAKEYLFF